VYFDAFPCLTETTLCINIFKFTDQIYTRQGTFFVSGEVVFKTPVVGLTEGTQVIEARPGA
jgi:hypothetical protein